MAKTQRLTSYLSPRLLLAVAALVAATAGSFVLPQNSEAARRRIAQSLEGAPQITPIGVKPAPVPGGLGQVTVKEWPDGTPYLEGVFGQYWYELPDGRRARLQVREKAIH